MQQRKPLANKRRVKKAHTGYIATGSTDTRHESGGHRIGSGHENDWNSFCDFLCCPGSVNASDNRRHLKSNQLSSEFWQSLRSAFCPTSLNSDLLTRIS